MDDVVRNGKAANGPSLHDRLALYKQMDETRHEEFANLAKAVISLEEQLRNVKADLEDEQMTRRQYRRRTEELESAASRNQFALVLVDGDGYIFKDAFLQEATKSGGADAASHLYNEIQNYLRANNHIPNAGDIEVMVNVYANKSGLARTLCDAGMIDHPSAFETFFQSFTRGKALFQFIDCGPGKERADAKLRDTYRFFAYNQHCRHIFLACCHDNGYVAELDKYRHDAVAAPKTILVHAAQAAREYTSLPFPVARFGTVFETSAILTSRQSALPKLLRATAQPYMTLAYNEVSTTSPGIVREPTPAESYASRSSMTSPPSSITAVPIRENSLPKDEENIPPKLVMPATKAAEIKPATTPSQTPTGDSKGIPINRQGQRIDRRLRQPSTMEQERFEARIRYRKLCNEHHLRNNCYQYSCKYDHDPLDAEMKNTLRYVARRIPCTMGMKCRRADCYYGHQCPWGNDNCNNFKCGFIQKGMHDVNDLEIAKFVPAAPV